MEKQKKVDMILTDLDGSLIIYPNSRFQGSWDWLMDQAGAREEHEKLLEYYIPRKELYVEWLEKEVLLLRGKKVPTIINIPYANGAKEFFEKTKGNYVRGILSGGIDIVAEKAKKDFNLEFSISKVLGRSNGFFTGKVKGHVDLWCKDKLLKEIIDYYHLSSEKICYIGDHENDIPIFKIVGFPVAINPKTKEVEKEAKLVVDDYMKIFPYLR